ncbi:hypothetical protein BKA57DRAFT_467403 [Linnemannia elongata]|nr:hypothetical protein BKA57DRAFT_467403 [Linnemannia elongata]
MPIPYCHHHRHLSCSYFHILTLAFSLLISLLSSSFLRPSDPLSPYLLFRVFIYATLHHALPCSNTLFYAIHSR